MCVSKGAPKKPTYGPCNETHGKGTVPPSNFGYTNSYNYYSGTTAYNMPAWASTTANTATSATGWITV